jgi:predicted unusual protein kinase regulating ubiquinone biosynthesis (AarF/ABC1/UbiB family)
MDENRNLKEVAVPASRASRLGKLGSLAGRIAGNLLIDSGKEIVKGRKPTVKKLLLNEKNIKHLADQLATMRGAAMKAGQMLSMDTGSILPPELAAILDRLRSDAVIMPSLQLIEVLEKNWGPHWQERFERFSFEPIAAASIGQVHKARTQSGLELAVKIQYPGVKKSIDSDIDNVFSLLRMSGFIPKDVDLSPLIDEARTQLKREADYFEEGQQIRLYAKHMDNFRKREELLLPEYYEQFSTEEILSMSFVSGQNLEKLQYSSQEERNRVISLLMELFFAEFLQFGCVQTDPNMANYLYNIDSRQLALLDFGATRNFSETFRKLYLKALLAAVESDKPRLTEALYELGFFNQGLEVKNLEPILNIFILATEPLRALGAYDFAGSDLSLRIKERGMAISSSSDAWHTPPPDVLFLHRKMAGLYLLASRFNARIDVANLFKEYAHI